VPTEPLYEAAVQVLRHNDLGGWTRPAPRLYPHQWSWDSAFIALGLARLDPRRALCELETLFAAQWDDGRVPHIVFNPGAGEYFPGPEWWASARSSLLAPRAPATSGLIQPPVHALALQRILEVAPADLRARIGVLYEKVFAWHRYLASARDPSAGGLLTIYHPWESGTDNSPRWDAALGRVNVGTLPAYERHDLKHVHNVEERPTRAEYDRYLWLVELLKIAHYDDATVQREYPFQIQDVLMSAIFAAGSQALLEVAEALRRPVEEREQLLAWSQRSSRAVQQRWDPALNLALDIDLHAGPVRVETCAGLAPLLVPELDVELRDQVTHRLFGSGFAGAERLAYPVIPSTSPGTPGFQARTYWRGPVWPMFNWLMWWGLRFQGLDREAEALRQANLHLLRRPESRFAEYLEPYTSEPLGSIDQSWTAALTIDWL
jgi:hypothetical protein